jgi:hypothetical protein
VTGISPQAERAAYAPTASLRTGSVMSDADPESPAMQSVVDTVQARRGGTVAPQAMQPPPPGPQVAQANVFPNPVVAADGRVAPIIPGGGLPPAPAPAIAKAPEPPSAQIRSAPEVPEVRRLTPPTPPRLQPMVDDYIRQQATIANDPRLSDTTRAMALKQIEKRQGQIKAVNDQTLLEYNDYRKRYEDQNEPKNVYSTEEQRRKLIPEGFFALTPEERASLPKVPGVDYYKDRWGNLKEIKAPASTSVQVDTAGEKEESKIRGKLAAERENEVIQSANKAGENLTTIARAEALHNKISTGALEPNRTTIAAIGKSLGVPEDVLRSIGLKPEEVGSRQAFQAIVNELTMGKIGPGGMPANNFSEGDRKFLTQTQISLGDDPEANRIKLAAARKMAELNIERSDRWGDFKEDPANKGKSYAEFERVWNRELKGRNEFGELNQRAEDLIKNAQQGPGQAGIPGDLPASTPVDKIVSDGNAAFQRIQLPDGKLGWKRLK